MPPPHIHFPPTLAARRETEPRVLLTYGTSTKVRRRNTLNNYC